MGKYSQIVATTESPGLQARRFLKLPQLRRGQTNQVDAVTCYPATDPKRGLVADRPARSFLGVVDITNGPEHLLSIALAVLDIKTRTTMLTPEPMQNILLDTDVIVGNDVWRC